MHWRLLNQERDVTCWEDPSVDRLWLYNLHYFDDLNADGAAGRRAWHNAAIARWIADNPPGGGPGWEPYPTSLRIVNWIKFLLSGNELSPEAQHSLAVQARWLMHRIEWHLLGNHLFSNAKALLFAGTVFEGAEAERWRRRGQDILEKQFGEQVLADGGQFERSPMYHALALEDALDLLNLARTFGRPEWPAPADIDRMRQWLATMAHPDGEICLFNDAAIGIAPSPAELEGYAGRLERPPVSVEGPVTALRATGYTRLQLGPVVAILDVAPLGPDYLPAHGHADTLSFEMSFRGQRLLVDSGTGLYGINAERLRQRGTAAHNTVVIDGRDSSQVWGGFRVGRRAHPINVVCETRSEGLYATGGHDGYAHLPGKPYHYRQWRLAPGEFSIEDTVTGTFHTAHAYLHFHPEVDVEPQGGGYDILMPNRDRLHLSLVGGEGSLVRSTWHPEFGLRLANTALVVAFAGAALTTTLRW